MRARPFRVDLLQKLPAAIGPKRARALVGRGQRIAFRNGAYK